MNTLEVSLTLRYDDSGNVVGYELSAPPTGEPDVIMVTSLDDPPSLSVRATSIVTTRLIGAINSEFNLPPIPGMQR